MSANIIKPSVISRRGTLLIARKVVSRTLTIPSIPVGAFRSGSSPTTGPCRSDQRLSWTFFATNECLSLHHAQPRACWLPTRAAVMSSASAPAGKRKRDPTASTKFYAVRVGKTPGVYYSWPDCLEQVKGFPKAAFKSFTTLTEAENFVQHDRVTDGKVTKWYGVQAGRKPGVYTSWQDVLDQITGWKGPRHKVFKSKVEAEQYVAEASNLSNALLGESSAANSDAGEPASKKSKTSKSRKSAVKEEEPSLPLSEQGEYEPGEAPLGEDTCDGFDPTIILDPVTQQLRYRTREERQQLSYHAARPAAGAAIRIYTDGSSLGNGQKGALGGVGVYFGPGDRRNVSEPLAGTRQTNQRAELTAVQRALEMAPRDRRIVIVSDSKYAIDCVTDWFRNWQRNGWVNAARKPVENRDLVQKVIDLLEERMRLNEHRMSAMEKAAAAEALATDAASATNKRAYWNRGPGGVLFEWVKGHDKDESNNAADRLAVAGAQTAQELMRLGEDINA